MTIATRDDRMKRLLAVAFGVALVAASCGPGGGSPVASPAATPSGTDVAVVPTGSPSTPRPRRPGRPPRTPRSGRSGSRWTGLPTRTTRASTWRPRTAGTRDAGVDFRVLPYGTTAPEALVGAGQAECGISFQDALTFAVAAGAPIVSVMAILQHTAQVIAVLDILHHRPTARPRRQDVCRASATRTRSRR